MKEQRGAYDPQHVHPDPDAEDVEVDGVERISDILRRVIDERDWPLLLRATSPNGDGRSPNGNPRHGDA